jgi:hypothetical protein
VQYFYCTHCVKTSHCPESDIRVLGMCGNRTLGVNVRAVQKQTHEWLHFAPFPWPDRALPGREDNMRGAAKCLLMLGSDYFGARSLFWEHSVDLVCLTK